MTELKIGERVTITLEVVKARGCSGCIFNKASCISGEFGLNCILPDGTGIILKKLRIKAYESKRISRNIANKA